MNTTTFINLLHCWSCSVFPDTDDPFSIWFLHFMTNSRYLGYSRLSVKHYKIFLFNQLANQKLLCSLKSDTWDYTLFTSYISDIYNWQLEYIHLALYISHISYDPIFVTPDNLYFLPHTYLINELPTWVYKFLFRTRKMQVTLLWTCDISYWYSVFIIIQLENRKRRKSNFL